jgi:maltose alpha-D-glucosyltransferase/alpha-amylase
VLDLWYNNAVIYGLNVATYKDGNGDGIGDFKGLTDRLDHIAQLGVTCLWLLPFYPSPGLDHGYDVTDYYNVAPALGTLGDFVEFSHQARLRGLRLIVDLPINHTSEQHPWFQQARADPKSPVREYYVWSKLEPPNSADGVVFPGFQSSAWTYDLRARAWYYHRFYQYQPDLNIACSAVREEMFKILGFWLELGVSGFRIDAAPFVVEEVSPDRPARRRYEFFGELRDFLSWRKGDSVLLAEANVRLSEIEKYFGDGSRIHLLFAFLLKQYLFLALAQASAAPLQHCLRSLPTSPQFGQWAQFLRTHDELDLGRLTADEREQIYAAFAPERHMQLYGRGIRRRLASMLDNDRRRIELVFSILFSLPGTPVIYYGDELGMGDDLCLPERWPVRTCMQWADDDNGGFSTAPEDSPPASGDHRRGFWFIQGERCHATARSEFPAELDAPSDRGTSILPGDRLGGIVIARHRRAFRVRRTHLMRGQVSARSAQPRGRLVHCPPSRTSERCKIADLFGNRIYPSQANADPCVELDGFGYRWFRVD